jgi:predicted nucleic acid-binding protein
MSLIVDASVAVKWFLDEEGCEQARALLDHEAVQAPDLILLETYNAVWKRWRRGEARPPQLRELVATLTRALDALHPLSTLADEAGRLAVELRHPVYDCTYLALAAREGLPLVTADEKLFRLAERLGLEVRRL